VSGLRYNNRSQRGLSKGTAHPSKLATEWIDPRVLEEPWDRSGGKLSGKSVAGEVVVNKAACAARGGVLIQRGLEDAVDGPSN